MKTPQEIRARSAKRKAEQAIEAPKAMKDYRAAEEAIRRRTERLREQRLLRESLSARDPAVLP